MLENYVENNIIFRSISWLWNVSSWIYNQIRGETHPTLDIHQNAVDRFRQRRYLRKVYIAIVFLVIVWVFLIINIVLTSFVKEDPIIPEMDGSVPNESQSMEPSSSLRHIYIDIGCFNGETIDHFLHFTPNSAIYEIYTFEPDPDNYLLCKKRFSDERYAHLNIAIIKKVVWIRDEKVYYQAEHGRQSRISANVNSDDGESIQLDAIDFSSWLVGLGKPNETRIHIKMSMPGAEVSVLEKMIIDDTLGYARKYEIEWTDRLNPRYRAIRIYIQLMFDTYGFDCLYYIRLQDTRRIYQINGSFEKVTKHYDWEKISESDTLAHYVERLDEPQSKNEPVGNDRV